uniref:Uncharacterized protein n=1 Tax=Fundulus heteroclitus TaxID=8078 RepID=A0A3Q2NSM2_FUNHE
MEGLREQIVSCLARRCLLFIGCPSFRVCTCKKKKTFPPLHNSETRKGSCNKQVEKEKRELARQYGMVRSEVSGGEIAEELEKERRSFQLSMCEYLIKVNEIKTKRGVDLLQNLIKHYHIQMTKCGAVLSCAQVKQRQEEEKRQLCAIRDQLRPVVHTEQDSLPKQVYSMHQLLGDKQYGTERTGFLYKKSDG